MYYRDEIEILLKDAEPKTTKKLQLPLILRLIKKLEEKKISDDTLELMFKHLAGIAKNLVRGQTKGFNEYKKKNYEITVYVQREYELTAKGYYVSLYMAIGLAIGAGIGVALSSAINPAFVALGVGPGLAAGLALGTMKDKKTEEEGKLY